MQIPKSTGIKSMGSCLFLICITFFFILLFQRYNILGGRLLWHWLLSIDIQLIEMATMAFNNPRSILNHRNHNVNLKFQIMIALVGILLFYVQLQNVDNEERYRWVERYIPEIAFRNLLT